MRRSLAWSGVFVLVLCGILYALVANGADPPAMSLASDQRSARAEKVMLLMQGYQADLLRKSDLLQRNYQDEPKVPIVASFAGPSDQITEITNLEVVAAQATKVVLIRNSVPVWMAKAHSGDVSRGSDLTHGGITTTPGSSLQFSAYSPLENPSVGVTIFVDANADQLPSMVVMQLGWQPLRADLNNDGRIEPVHFLAADTHERFVIAGLAPGEAVELRFLYPDPLQSEPCGREQDPVYLAGPSRFCRIPTGDGLQKLDATSCPTDVP